MIYPYDAKREDELVLRPGDVIDVEEQSDNWWKGRKVGFDPWKWFHKDFIAPEPLPDKDNKPVEREPTGQQVYYQGREYYADVQCEHLIKDAQCSVCLNLACNPCQTQCCGHTVCAECANTWKLQNDSCHHCRTPSCFWQTDVRIRRQIAGLTIYCAHYSSGCDWRGNIHRLQKHLNESCPIVVCQNEGCTEKVQRKYITEHMTQKCSQRVMRCPFCNQDSLNYQELISTHYRTCGNWPLRCPQSCSNGDLTRSTLGKHIASECSESVCPCPLVEYGCKATVKRKDLHRHVHSHHKMAKGSLNAIVSDWDSNWKACTEKATANMSQVLQTTLHDVIPAVRSRTIDPEQAVRDVKQKLTSAFNNAQAEYEKNSKVHWGSAIRILERKMEDHLATAKEDLKREYDVSLTKADTSLRSESEVKPEKLTSKLANIIYKPLFLAVAIMLGFLLVVVHYPWLLVLLIFTISLFYWCRLHLQ